MKWFHFSRHWKLFLLRRKYVYKLAEVNRNRWKHCKYGTVTKRRAAVHEWYVKESNRIIAGN